MERDLTLISERMSGFAAETMGLNFPRERWADLQRGLATAADESGFENVPAYVDWLLSASPTEAQIKALSIHLTVGETYFFRERKTLDIFANQILPELIGRRRGKEQRLRLWSAGCCTGEEAYSLAILIRQLLPDLADWNVTILATDINARFLRKAAAGCYGTWSFRETPSGFKERYFQQTAEGRFQIAPEIQRLVTFAHLNLGQDTYPSLASETNAMDVIFCRNVLMYFTAARMRKVIGNLHRALIDGGWLAVSPSEVSQALFPQFATRNFPGVILYQRDDQRARGEQTPRQEPLEPELGSIPDEPHFFVSPPASLAPPPAEPLAPMEPVELSGGPQTQAAALYERGCYAEAAEVLLAVAGELAAPESLALLARALANQGKLAEALPWCDRWIAADKMDAGAHYLQAVILLEQGAAEPARQALLRALYLQPDFVLPHFALGNLARRNNKLEEADRHFANALHLLEGHEANDPLPASEGITAGRLTETITMMTALQAR